jgi:hypothetical protein
MFMHRIALCAPCIALVNYGHLLHIRVDHTEPVSEFQSEQVWWVFRGPQVSSNKYANIVVIKANHGATIGSLNLNFGSIDGLWLNWRSGGAIKWKVETTNWEGREVVCDKSAPSRL